MSSRGEEKKKGEKGTPKHLKKSVLCWDDVPVPLIPFVTVPLTRYALLVNVDI